MDKKAAMVWGGLWAILFAVGPVWAFQLPDTGITKCYDDYREIPCPAPGKDWYGQDAQYAGAQPAYRDNGNGTITDLNTGLMWQEGDSQNDAGGRTWQEACDFCDGITLPSGGYSDWRLPNRRELMSIALYGQCGPSISTTYFPDCRSFYYWSSSTHAEDAGHAWRVNFVDGGVSSDAKKVGYYVRCVRNGP